MRVTIIPAHDQVYVNGQVFEIDCSALDFHALQFDLALGRGWIEPTPVFGEDHPQNVPITDFSPYQSYLDAWEAMARGA